MDSATGRSEITFVVPKMSPEVCDVVVDPYKALPETEEEDGFAVKAPEIVSVDPGYGSVGNQITIYGKFFGTKKGKVYLDDVGGKLTEKSCVVPSWPTDPTKEEGEIIFVVPNGLPPGNYHLIVTNSVGSAVLTGGFTIAD